MRLSGHGRLMSVPTTVGLSRDDEDSFYNTHLVTRPLGEIYYPDDAYHLLLPFKRDRSQWEEGEFV